MNVVNRSVVRVVARQAAVGLARNAAFPDAANRMKIVTKLFGAVPIMLRLVAEQTVVTLEQSVAPVLQRDAARLDLYVARGDAAPLGPSAVDQAAVRKDQHAVAIVVAHQARFVREGPVLLHRRTVRYEMDVKRNGHLLRNTCNAMQGENTMLLTYSGPANTPDKRQAKREKRRQAGCVDRFCQMSTNGGRNSSLDSCDDWPPACSDQGGDTLLPSNRAVSCIPRAQNVFQGWTFNRMMSTSSIKQGDSFAISIDCDEVMKAELVAPAAEDLNSGTASPDYNIPSDENSYLIIPFGDLEAGRQVITAVAVSFSAHNKTDIQ
ncbi:hypothetical protein VNI00_006636 [Paramarasmius palmivorus]|uniref:Deoxyribonuclease NucA/NucB domain-containing protein n=1 Tax=Paramarasmius palmivorus TaxID=297713 RepID=A0AAW0D8F0_9AGAR